MSFTTPKKPLLYCTKLEVAEEKKKFRSLNCALSIVRIPHRMCLLSFRFLPGLLVSASIVLRRRRRHSSSSLELQSAVPPEEGCKRRKRQTLALARKSPELLRRWVYAWRSAFNYLLRKKHTHAYIHGNLHIFFRCSGYLLLVVWSHYFPEKVLRMMCL